jgi:hypothetical protein
MAHELDNFFDRILRAHADFADYLVNKSGVSRETAIDIKNYYLKHKLAKVDAGIGRISVKHGGFLDRDVILRAAAFVER